MKIVKQLPKDSRSVPASAVVLCAALCAGGLACKETGLQTVNDAGAPMDGAAGAVAVAQTFPVLGGNQVDILFMVDNSLSMAPLQAKLAAGFRTFIDTLNAQPGGPPDMHIAVISSDTGPGKYDLPTLGCSFTGDAGRFQFQPRGAVCNTSPFRPGQTFIQTVNGVPSYTGDIVDAFTCIAALGEQGCGFEGQLKSVRWALDPLNVPYPNGGFLRPAAHLAVVLVTNEDDCSMPDDSDLGDPTQTSLSSPLGPFTSFRCNEFGHLCQINGHLRSPPRAAADNLAGCISNDTSSGHLTKVADEVKFLASLKSSPNQILAAAITGPATPYGIEMVQPAGGAEAYPSVKHSCAQSADEYADPAVRIQQWVNSFGSNGLLLPICADSMAPQLATIAQRIGQSVSAMCVSGPFNYGISPNSTQPDCRVVDRFSDATTGGYSDQSVPNCLDSANMPPCWTTVDDPLCEVGTKLLKIDRGSTPSPDLGVTFTCAPCAATYTEVGCPVYPHPLSTPFP
jgi:hypothetical protein